MTVSLVLGSGGARGLAHIGVIRVLERHGWKIGAISGIIKPASQQEAIETADRYLRLLRRLYSDWPARNDPNGQIVTLRKSPYVIQVMRFQMPLEVRVNLKFDRDAAENAAWTAVLKRESERYQVEARRRLVEDAASKGLK